MEININKKRNKGFTILEVIVAIFILTISITSMLSLTASSVNVSRYANFEITANYLAQEAVDSIRNSRDTLAFQRQSIPGFGWDTFITRYNDCFSTNGCYLRIEDFDSDNSTSSDIEECSNTCPNLFIDDRPMDEIGGLIYKSNNSGGVEKVSPFSRKVKMKMIDPYQVEVIAEVTFDTGNVKKTISLKTYLLKWQ